MTKPTMTSQWDPDNYKPLDMSKIPGYPRQMPPISKRWLPRFTGGNGERADFHMDEFYSYFRLHPVDDDAEDVVMKLFSNTLHGNAKKWYDNLPNASITSMNQLEEIFLEEWGIQLEDISVLLKNFEHIRQTENETLWNFQSRFEHTLYQIPKGHCPENKYIVHIYTRALLAHLGLPLSKKSPGTLDEAYGMAKRIEQNISLSGIKDLFTSGDFNMGSLFARKNFIDDIQEEGEQTIIQRGIPEDMAEEAEPKQNNEVSTSASPSDEAIYEPVSPAQQKEDEVSYFPFQDSDDTLSHHSDKGGMEFPKELDLPTEEEGVIPEDETIMHAKNTKVLEVPAQEETISYPPPLVFDDALPYDEGNEEEENEFSNVSNPACYDTDSDIVDNIDEFIHVGRRRWDIVGYDLDPIYDTESHFQLLPLQLSQQITSNQWQQGDEIFTRTFQKTKDDLVPYSPDDFQSYLEIFYESPSEHLDSLHEDDCQQPLCSDFDTSKDIVCLKKVSHDFSLQPPVITLPCFSIKGVVGKYLFYVEFPLRQALNSRVWLDTASLSKLSQFFNFPLVVCQSSARSLSIPSLTSECEDALGSQFAGPLSQFSEPCSPHDPFLKWIEYFPQRWTWQDFIPPTRLHELELEIFDDMIYVLTHVIFVLDLSLFWFMMKHKGRYWGTLLD
jgi:hypothetical protein